LEKVIENALRDYLDVESMLAEQEIQAKERDELKKIRHAVLLTIREFGYEV